MNDPISKLPIGDKAPDIVNAVIEIPRDSHNKYEFREETGIFELDRVLSSPLHYPVDYGFIPATRSDDGDHLDIMVIGSDPLFTGCVLEVRPVGFLKMIDGGEEDFKILGVQVKNPRFYHLKDLPDVEAWNGHLLKEIVHFMEAYKHLEGKSVTTEGWGDAAAAHDEIRKAQETYNKEH